MGETSSCMYISANVRNDVHVRMHKQQNHLHLTSSLITHVIIISNNTCNNYSAFPWHDTLDAKIHCLKKGRGEDHLS